MDLETGRIAEGRNILHPGNLNVVRSIVRKAVGYIPRVVAQGPVDPSCDYD